ncbi:MULTISPECIES: GspH/FimT family pseudopilin [unclassified Sphingobium]|uniref:GspH/FimT family pseudopilin n=1 Tax=unclassified Sphingobium TaxID=2611147 RepID=UPI0035A5B0E4
MSLIEALIAVAISVLIASIAFPAMDSAWESSRQTSAASTLLANLRVARAQAVRGGQPVAMAISADGRRYSIGATVVDLPDPLVLRARPARISFYPDGSASAAQLALTGPRATQMLHIRPVTGLVEAEAPAR